MYSLYVCMSHMSIYFIWLSAHLVLTEQQIRNISSGSIELSFFGHGLYLLVPIFLSLQHPHSHIIFVLLYHALVSLFSTQPQSALPSEISALTLSLYSAGEP